MACTGLSCGDPRTDETTGAGGAGGNGGSGAGPTTSTGGDGGTGGSTEVGGAGGASCAGTTEVWDLVELYAMEASDAKPAVDMAIADAKVWLDTCGPDSALVLAFPAGTWEFKHNGGPAIVIEDVVTGRLTLRGDSAETTSLVFRKFDEQGISLQNAHAVTIERLHLTRHQLYTSQGEVTEILPDGLRFKVHEGFPDPAELASQENALNNDRTLIKFRGPDLDPELAPKSVSYKLCEHDPVTCPAAIVGTADPEVFEAIFQPGQDIQLKPGDRVALKAKVGANTLRAVDCNDFTMEDVRVTRSSGASIVVDGASNRTRIEDVRIERSEPINGRTPFFAGPGGGPQIEAETEGPIIRGCSITGTTDDAIAVFSSNSTDATTLMSGAVIENNTVRDTQGRSINITQSRSGICRFNTLIRGHNPSIQLKNNQTADMTNAAVLDWIIEDNTLIQPWTYPAIFITEEQSNTSSGLIDGVQIRHNTFQEASKLNPVIQIRHAASVEIAENIILSFSDADDFADNEVPSPVPLVFVESASAVVGADNACVIGAPDRPPVFIGDEVADPTAITVTWPCE